MTGEPKDLLTALYDAVVAARSAQPLTEVRPHLTAVPDTDGPARCPDCGCTWPHPVDATDCACDDATGGALTAPSHTRPPTA